MIGFFDSGFGGLTIMKEVVKKLPAYSYVYLGDNARTPYGSRSKDVIYRYTTEGIEELFRRGAKLVVLACNTSSAVALRKIQQEWLPEFHPDKKVLGIIIPTSEMIAKSGKKNVGVFATEATVRSKSFSIEIGNRNHNLTVAQQTCPLLVPIIESGELEELDHELKKYVNELFCINKKIDAVILGCTHYAIIENVFRKHVPKNVKIISQGKIVAKSLKDYLKRHPEVDGKFEKKNRMEFLTTENSPHIQHLAEIFYGEKINLEFVNLNHKSRSRS